MQVRCAIYTRKSSDEGLDQTFNSLDAQREACEAYIKSQRHGGWRALPAAYDDGGLSGGSLERPALKRLMLDIDAGRVDMIVVYKIDRLTRSLADFAKLVERLDAAGASFVSVTQQFNTSTSMGRLTLNVILSFAQFEREVTAERIRDKIAASKKKGMWMGGRVPLGYDRSDKTLIVNVVEAETVRTLFRAYLDLGSVRRLKDYADKNNLVTKRHKFASGKEDGGVPFSRGRLYHLLSNPVYIGKIRHKNESYDGLHDAIVEEAIWDRAQALLSDNAGIRSSRTNATDPSLLAGKLFDVIGEPLTPSHATKKGRRYGYYVSRSLIRNSGDGDQGWRLPAQELEACVRAALLNDPERSLSFSQTGMDPLSSVSRVHISPDQMTIWIVQEGPNCGELEIEAPFSMARRGVETRLVLAGSHPGSPDPVLARRILRAMKWVDQMKAGAGMAAVAEAEGISPVFVKQNIHAAFLSPAILNTITDGRQPPDLTAKALTRIRLPDAWQDQSASLQIDP
tara:strand:+ start:583 stop:2115 length:1533 start_codon:yes stop_codon:yes gene_type:complete